MFKIEPFDLLENDVVRILSGTRFCVFEKPIIFKLESDVISEPLYVEVVATRPSDDLAGKITLGPIIGDRVRLTLFHPPIGVPVFPVHRQHILFEPTKKVQLTFSFLLVCQAGSDSFLLYYEFYEEPVTSAQTLPSIPVEGLKS